MSDYICSISGVQSLDIEEPPEYDEDLEDLPLGWRKVTIQSRMLNPEWVMLQQIKKAMIEQAIAQADESVDDTTKAALALSIDAQYAALENRINTYLYDDETVFVAPDERNDQLAQAWDKILNILDLKQ
jgi:hypothetical protein